MVEVTQEVRELCANFLQSQDADGYPFNAFRRGQCDDNPLTQVMQAAFNAGRASVLAELESPSEAMALSGVASFTFSKNDLQQVKAIFTAMIGAYKEAL